MRLPRTSGARLLRGTAAAVWLGAAGCMTYYDEQQAEAQRQSEDVRILQEQMRPLNGRIEGLEMETQRLGREIENLRRATESSGQARLTALQQQLESLSQRVGELSAARERDRQAILEDVSKKVAELLRRSAGSTGGSSGGTRATGSRSEYGYEHVVKAGETLSAIAVAYGVSTRAIQEVNGLKSDQIRIGQKLFIPEKK